MSGNTITVTTVRLDSSIPKNTRCAICGEDQWFHHTPRFDKRKPSILFPCTWNIGQRRAYAHLGEVVIAQVFKNTIEGRQILLTASERSHRIFEMQYRDDDEEGKKSLVNDLVKNLRKSKFGNKLSIRTKLKALKSQFIEQTQIVDPSSYEILKVFENLDIHDAFAWMRNEPRSEQDMDDEKSSMEVASSSESSVNVYVPIDPPSPNSSDKDSDDSDDDAHVDW